MVGRRGTTGVGLFVLTLVSLWDVLCWGFAPAALGTAFRKGQLLQCSGAQGENGDNDEGAFFAAGKAGSPPSDNVFSDVGERERWERVFEKHARMFRSAQVALQEREDEKDKKEGGAPVQLGQLGKRAGDEQQGDDPRSAAAAAKVLLGLCKKYRGQAKAYRFRQRGKSQGWGRRKHGSAPQEVIPDKFKVSESWAGCLRYKKVCNLVGEEWIEGVKEMALGRDSERGVEILLAAKRRATHKSAFDLLVALGVWTKHENLPLLRSDHPLHVQLPSVSLPDVVDVEVSLAYFSRVVQRTHTIFFPKNK